jgi:hypothetical protein
MLFALFSILIGLGASLASSLSFKRHQSVFYGAAHGCLSWLYVFYVLLVPADEPEKEAARPSFLKRIFMCADING